MIYKSSDVRHPSKSPSAGCKSHELHLKRREEEGEENEEEQTSTPKPPQPESFKGDKTVIVKKRVKRSAVSDEAIASEFEDVLYEAISESELVHDGTAMIPPEPRADRQTVTTFEIVDWDDVPESVRSHFRNRARKRGKNKIDPKKRTCMLYLQADHLFYEQMGSEEAAIDVMTRHVQRVNSIYKEIGEKQIRKTNILFLNFQKYFQISIKMERPTISHLW